MKKNQFSFKSIIKILSIVLIILMIIWIISIAYINTNNNEFSNVIMNTFGFVIPVFKKEYFELKVKTLPANFPYGASDHEITISTNKDQSYKIEGNITWTTGNRGMVPNIWLDGITHQLLGTNKIEDYIFISHEKKPLTFKVYIRNMIGWKIAVYSYKSGKGSIQAANGKVIDLPIYWYDNSKNTSLE